MPGTMKLRCEAGNHDWERTAQRGRPPRNCPEHQPAKIEKPRKLSEPTENPQERMARLREIKAQRAAEREEMAFEAETQRRIELAAALPALCEAYEAAFDAANHENTPEAWRRADILQHRIITTRKAIAA
jgi:hypothetical protein